MGGPCIGLPHISHDHAAANTNTVTRNSVPHPQRARAPSVIKPLEYHRISGRVACVLCDRMPAGLEVTCPLQRGVPQAMIGHAVMSLHMARGRLFRARRGRSSACSQARRVPP